MFFQSSLALLWSHALDEAVLACDEKDLDLILICRMFLRVLADTIRAVRCMPKFISEVWRMGLRFLGCQNNDFCAVIVGAQDFLGQHLLESKIQKIECASDARHVSSAFLFDIAHFINDV